MGLYCFIQKKMIQLNKCGIDESMPFIVIGKPTSDIDHQFTHIDNDNILASENLTRHVIEQGVDELIFIAEKEILKFQR